MVTIGMPIRNCEATLAQAIRSLQLQTFRDWNLIMIDDGSTDRTVEVASRFSDERITILVDGMHRGLPARLNQILSLTNSPYFGRMDADDIAYPQRLERQSSILKHPEVDSVAAPWRCSGVKEPCLERGRLRTLMPPFVSFRIPDFSSLIQPLLAG